MKRIFAAITVLFFCLITSACSAAAEFFVINQSDAAVEIEYTLNSNLKALDDRTTIPLKMNFDDWNSWFRDFREIEWRETPADEFTYDMPFETRSERNYEAYVCRSRRL
jgi:hypothetical protein